MAEDKKNQRGEEFFLEHGVEDDDDLEGNNGGSSSDEEEGVEWKFEEEDAQTPVAAFSSQVWPQSYRFKSDFGSICLNRKFVNKR